MYTYDYDEARRYKHGGTERRNPAVGGGERLTVGARLGQQPDAVERVAPRVPVVEVTVRIDEDVYEAAMLRATYDGYDNASEVIERRCESGAGVLGCQRSLDGGIRERL